eukprot:Lankesteria_metandrocarpae@DN5247_c1_g1_i2.p1
MTLMCGLWVVVVFGISVLLALTIFAKVYAVGGDDAVRFLSSRLGHQASSMPIVYAMTEDGRPMPKPATGPKDALYLQHEFLDTEYRLVLDTSSGYTNFTNDSFPSGSENWTQALRYRNGWIQRVRHFRRFLYDEGKNNVDPGVNLKDAVYRKEKLWDPPENVNATNHSELVGTGNEDSTYHSKHQRVVPDLDTFIPNDDPAEAERRFTHCIENPTDCGSIDCPVIVNISLVLPLRMSKVNSSLWTLESLRQLIVFPKEIVLVASGAYQTAEVSHTLAFLTILREFYAPQLPKGVIMKVYAAKMLYKPGESRWFGFNQTTMPVVLQFDADDYMHPQMFQVMYTVFKHRPELDYGLFRYEGDIQQGEYSHDNMYDTILKVLRKPKLTHDDIKHIWDYDSKEYSKVRSELPTWNKEWWLGNTDAEPDWNKEQMWWDYGCANGWSVYRRRVMETIAPPVNLFGGEDAIYNYRVVKSGFNYMCLPAYVGIYLKCVCTGSRSLWTKSELQLRPGEKHQVIPYAVDEAVS